MSSKPSRIGILGGSYDPVHCGHLAVAQLALEHLALDHVLLIPAAIPPHKRHVVSASTSQRLTMLRRAAGDNRALRVWDTEIRRGGVSYTIDTLHELRERHPNAELCFIIGSDNLREISSWHRYRAILRMVTLCVAHRPGHAMKPPGEIAATRMAAIPSPEWGVSSTMIRRRIARGLSCRYLIPESVRVYVERHALYSMPEEMQGDERTTKG